METQQPPVFYPDSGNEEKRKQICCILQNKLYLTNWRGAENSQFLKNNNITHIINLCSEHTPQEAPQGTTYKNIDNITDSEEKADALQGKFQECVEFINKANNQNQAVLVHCLHGISRSSTMVLAFLIINQKMKLYDAFKLTIGQRSVIWPNNGFMKALINLEKSVLKLKQSSINIQDYEQWGNFSIYDYRSKYE